MDVKIIATHSCTHRPNLERELRDLGIPYELVYVEDHPEVAERYRIRHSPNLVVDDQEVCRGQPSEAEIKALLLRLKPSAETGRNSVSVVAA